MNTKKPIAWMIYLGAAIPLGILLGVYFHISQDILIVFATISLLVFGAVLMWNRANANATGDEWWQDDECSGWRGY